MKTAPAIALTCLFVLSCSSEWANRRDLRTAVAVVMNRVDGSRQAVLLADDAQIQRVQDLVGPGWRVVSLSKFAKEHPEEAVPFNIHFEGAEWKDGAAIVRVHVQAISHPPPQVLFCGTGYVFKVERLNKKWYAREIQASVC